MAGYVFLVGLIFFWRYLFVVTVMVEERAAGWIYEPKRLQTSIIEKEFAPFTLIFSGSTYPFLKVKYKEKTFPVLFYPYVNLLYIYIPRMFLKIFGENILSLRVPILISLLLFLYLYIRFSEKICGLKGAIFSSLFLISFPIFGMRFFSLATWNDTCVFIFSILLADRIREISDKKVIDWKDWSLIFLFGGLMLHFHLLAGGALFISTLSSLLISAKRYDIKFQKHYLILLGIISFIILISTFFLLYFKPQSIFYQMEGHPVSKIPLFLRPFHTIFMYLVGILFPSSFINVVISGEIKPGYALFSGLPGFIILIGIYFVVSRRKNGFFELFIFYTMVFFLFLSLFVSDVRPYHINYFLILLPPFLFRYFQKDLKFIIRGEWGYRFLFLSIIFNLGQSEICVQNLRNSSLSLSLHKEVAKFIEKENIDKIYNLAGRYGYEFISKKKIEVIDFWDYLWVTHDPLKIAHSLLLARGGVVMVEEFKRSPLTTGISPEEVYLVARKMNLKVEVLKNFPDDENPKITFMRIE